MCAIRDARELVSHTVHTLLDSLPVGVLLRDAQTSITLTNAAARAMLGDIVPGAPDGHTLHRSDGSPVPADDRPLRRALERGEATADETLIVRSASGEERVHLVAATPVRDPHGHLVAAVSVFQDITALKRAEEDLARLSQMLATERSRVQAILDSASNAIFYVDAATDHVQANPEAERLVGHPIIPENGRAQFIGQIHDPEGHAVPRQDLPASRALQGDTPQRRELLIAQSDGAKVPVLANAAPVRTPDGRVPGAVVVLQDISALKELERVREEWTSVVAHDLRQPVALIGGYAGLLARDLASASPQLKAYVEDIRAGARQLNRMIADLLDASRLEANRLALARRPVDLGALVREVVERADPFTDGHAVWLSVQGAIPPLDVDPGRIEQVLVNLLSNAAKYGRAETPIEVRVAARGSEVEVAVTNEGPGIPPDELGGLFARFHRARSARQDETSGIGLGLYIAKGLVEAHGGRIWAESVPGETTTFRFTLPV
jgi:PAS domain S-box-containing protein